MNGEKPRRASGKQSFFLENRAVKTTYTAGSCVCIVIYIYKYISPGARLLPFNSMSVAKWFGVVAMCHY